MKFYLTHRRDLNEGAQSAGSVEYIACISANVPTPTSVLNMTLNHLIARLLPWRLNDYRVPLHCYYS